MIPLNPKVWDFDETMEHLGIDLKDEANYDLWDELVRRYDIVRGLCINIDLDDIDDKYSAEREKIKALVKEDYPLFWFVW